MKITIAHNHRLLVFYKNTRFRFNSSSPIFSDDGFFSLPFNIPVEENRLALDFCEKLQISSILPGRNLIPPSFAENSLSAVKIPVFIESSLFDYKSGYLFITPGNDEYICTLVAGQGKFNNEITGKLLSELCNIPINMGDNIDDFIASANEIITKSYPSADFNLPIIKIDQAYANELANEKFKMINYFKWDAVNPTFVKNDLLSIQELGGWFPDITLPTINNYTSYVACPFVFSILVNIIKNLCYNCIGNPLTDTKVNQLMFISNKSLDQISPINLNGLVKVGRSTVKEILILDPPTRPYRFEWDVYEPMPFQNHVIGADENGPIRILDYNQHWHFTRTTNSVVQCHYKLVCENLWDQEISIRLGIWKYLGNNEYSTSPIISNAAITTVSANSFKTIEGSFNIPAYIPNDNDFPLLVFGAIYINPDPSGTVTLRYHNGSTCDWVYISDQLSVKPLNNFNLKDYLPEITLKSLLNDLKYLFGIIPFVNSDTISLDYFKDIYNSTPFLNLSEYLLKDFEKSNTDKIKSISLPNGFDDSRLIYTISNSFPYSTIPNHLILLPVDGHFFKNDCDEYLNFSYSRYLQDLNKISFDVESGEEVGITASIPEVIIITSPDNSENKAAVPYLKSGLISAYNDSDLDASPDYLLSFWRGLQPDSQGVNYPYATPWVYKYNGSVLSGAIQIKFNGTPGLYSNYLTDLITVLNSENNILKVEFNLPINVVKNLFYNKKYIVAGIPVIIKSIDFEFDANDVIIQPVTLEIIKC